MVSKQDALARCLFEAIDDINFSNIIVLLEKHGADPNTIILKLQIAPIHYAVGFDNLEFAGKVTELFLKKKANANLVSDGDGLTPLMIASIWGRSDIVKMLLANGGDLDLKCKEGQTAITYAIQENNYQVVETIQKFVFEQKIDKKKKELILKSRNQDLDSSSSKQEASLSTPIRNNHLKNAIQSIDEKKFTPNRINYNFDATSPFYVNITHRRHKTSRENSKVFDETDSQAEEEKDLTQVQKNLFELTERNLASFSKQMSKVIVIDRLAIHKRRSYIKAWREKIQQIRSSDKRLDIDYINFLNSCNDVTLMNEDLPTIEVSDESEKEEKHSSGDSFITAKSDLQRFNNAIKNQTDYIEHVQEDYIHSDKENGMLLLEKKIISKSRGNLNAIDETETDHDEAKSCSSISTKVTLPPLDYDTDALRRELTDLKGTKPGPITKHTKHLYLKQLVKLQKRSELVLDHKKVFQKSYSDELQRSINNFEYLERNLSEYLKLEAQMSSHFLERAHIKWREGNIKTSFIYLLIDPRLSDNLPLHYKEMKQHEVWTKFISSIFYVGKGKRSRPYSHLYEAIKLFSMENNQVAERLENRKNQIIEKRVIYSGKVDKDKLVRSQSVDRPNQVKFQESKKLNKIVDIWKSQSGVVCLHIFNNIIPCEAYTREAAIIDTIDMVNLTNLKKGDYYGAARNFSIRQKRKLGVGLLHRAMNVYLAEGESQLMPFDLI